MKESNITNGRQKQRKAAKHMKIESFVNSILSFCKL